MKQDLKQKNRVLYLDVLRAIACLSVVMIHIGGNYRNQSPQSGLYWIGLLTEAPVRLAVPLFAMISGAMLLNESYPYSREKCRGHILHMLSFFFFWSAAYCGVFYVLRNVLAGEGISITEVLRQLFTGHYHLWFIPMVIGFYLLLPLLRLWVKEENRRYVRYFLILWFALFHLLPQLQQLLGVVHPDTAVLWIFPASLQLDYVLGYTGYFLLGWYLHTAKVPKEHAPGLWLVGLGALTVAILGTWGLSVSCGVHRSLYGTHSALICLWSSCVFCLIKLGLFQKSYTNSVFCRCVDFVCRHSLGVYAVHVAVITLAYKLVPFDMGLAQCSVVFLLAVATSLLIAAVMKKLPILKKFA